MWMMSQKKLIFRQCLLWTPFSVLNSRNSEICPDGTFCFWLLPKFTHHFLNSVRFWSAYFLFIVHTLKSIEVYVIIFKQILHQLFVKKHDDTKFFQPWVRTKYHSVSKYSEQTDNCPKLHQLENYTIPRHYSNVNFVTK